MTYIFISCYPVCRNQIFSFLVDEPIFWPFIVSATLTKIWSKNSKPPIPRLVDSHRTSVKPFIWPNWKQFCFWKILKFFSIKYLHLGTCFDSPEDILTLVPKKATRAWIHFSQFLPNIEVTIKLLNLQPKYFFPVFLTYIT